MGCTANIIVKDIIHIFASISENMPILLMGWRCRGHCKCVVTNWILLCFYLQICAILTWDFFWFFFVGKHIQTCACVMMINHYILLHVFWKSGYLNLVFILLLIDLGPISLTIFHHNSNSMEISFSCNSITGDHIATKFGTCHDSPAVVPCAKYCSDHYIIIWMRANWNFHHIWIVMEKLLVKWAPGPIR